VFCLIWLQIEDAMLMFDKVTQRHRGMIFSFIYSCHVYVKNKLRPKKSKPSSCYIDSSDILIQIFFTSLNF